MNNDGCAWDSDEDDREARGWHNFDLRVVCSASRRWLREQRWPARLGSVVAPDNDASGHDG
jgi:hypothetical protein